MHCEMWAVGMQERTARRIVRVYPKGTRTKSDNFDPLPCWAAGAPTAAFSLWLCTASLHVVGCE